MTPFETDGTPSEVVTIRYFAGPDLRRAHRHRARLRRQLLLSAISRDLISDRLSINQERRVVQLLSAISRDLISDMQAFAKASVRHMALLSAISRDLISDGPARRSMRKSSQGYYPLFRGT